MSRDIHEMGLYKEYFNGIKEGRKTVEVRLNDEKRRKIKIGDFIEFIDVTNQDEKLKVSVTNLRKYNSFEEMYKSIPFSDFDCAGWSMKDMIDGTYEIYPPEQEKKLGTLAITIKYCGG